jgi:Protein of unknown function (DUF3738)
MYRVRFPPYYRTPPLKTSGLHQPEVWKKLEKSFGQNHSKILPVLHHWAEGLHHAHCLESVRYTINAKAEGTASRDVTSGPMFQTILEDRFKLKYVGPRGTWTVKTKVPS